MKEGQGVKRYHYVPQNPVKQNPTTRPKKNYDSQNFKEEKQENNKITGKKRSCLAYRRDQIVDR